MTHDGEPRTMSRGGFVKAAAGASVAAAIPLKYTGAARAATSVSLNVGVMTAVGSSFAGMGPSLLDGLRLGFDDAGAGPSRVAATLVPATVDRGYGGALSAAQGLLDGGADLVVANVSAPVARRLAPLFEERQAALVVANVGAHVVRPGARSPFVLHSSLLYWQASFALGRWAAAKLGRRAFVAAALSDAGYDTVYAFRRGFESAGGTIVGEAVTHADPAHPALAELFASVRSARADVLFGLYSGAHGAEFLRAYKRAGLHAKLAVGSLAVEDYMLGSLGGAATGLASCASWTATRSSKTNQRFTKAFQSRYGRKADPFAALGYDTAALVAAGASRAAVIGLAPGRLVEALAGVSIDGPRGRLTVDAASNTVTGPLFVRDVKRGSGGLANYDIVSVPPVGSFPHALAALASNPASGYLNEYLCA